MKDLLNDQEVYAAWDAGELFPDPMAVQTFIDWTAPWCLTCGGFNVFSDRQDQWHVCPRGTSQGHGRFLPRGRWAA